MPRLFLIALRRSKLYKKVHIAIRQLHAVYQRVILYSFPVRHYLEQQKPCVSIGIVAIYIVNLQMVSIYNFVVKLVGEMTLC